MKYPPVGVRYSIQVDPENVFGEKLTFYVPWGNEESDILGNQFIGRSIPFKNVSVTNKPDQNKSNYIPQWIICIIPTWPPGGIVHYPVANTPHRSASMSRGRHCTKVMPAGPYSWGDQQTQQIVLYLYSLPITNIL